MIIVIRDIMIIVILNIHHCYQILWYIHYIHEQHGQEYHHHPEYRHHHHPRDHPHDDNDQIPLATYGHGTSIWLA